MTYNLPIQLAVLRDLAAKVADESALDPEANTLARATLLLIDVAEAAIYRIEDPHDADDVRAALAALARGLP